MKMEINSNLIVNLSLEIQGFLFYESIILFKAINKQLS